MTDLAITIDDAQIREAFARLAQRLDDFTPVMQQIGEQLLASTKDRFKTSTAPDGSAWAANSDLTLRRYLSKTKGNFKKDGSVSKKGQKRLAKKPPLIGQSKSLSTQFAVQAGRDQVTLSTNVRYAAVQQFGAKQGAFGRDRRNHPLPWGDIPARPFLGFSERDKADILAILSEYLDNAAEG
jgi:phage virion morphogenesis protein